MAADRLRRPPTFARLAVELIVAEGEVNRIRAALKPKLESTLPNGASEARLIDAALVNVGRELSGLGARCVELSHSHDDEGAL